VRAAILEQTSGPGAFNFVTIVEWRNSDAIEGARRAVAALHQKMNFDAQAVINRLEIRADIANYKRVEPAMAAEYRRVAGESAGQDFTRVAGSEAED
jgi:hypothetical protein